MKSIAPNDNTNENKAAQHNPWIAFLCIFVIAVAVRFLYLFELSDTPTFLTPLVDSEIYDKAARQLSEHGIWSNEFFLQGFSYPLFLAAAYKVSGGSIIFAKILQALLGGITALLTFRLAQQFAGRRAGIIAGLTVAFYGPLICLESELLATGLGTLAFITLLSLFLAADARLKTDTGNGSSWFLLSLAGAAGALAITIRGPLLIPFLAGILWLGYRSFRRRSHWSIWLKLLALPLGFVLIAVPIGFIHLEETGSFTIMPARSGINLFIGNNPDRIDTVNARPGPEFNNILNKPYRAGKTGLWESNDYFKQQVLSYIEKNPGNFLAGLAGKSIEMVNSREIPRNYDLYLFRDNSHLLSVLLWKIYGFGFPFGVLLPFAVIGLFYYRRKFPTLLPIFILSYSITIVLVFISGRYRLPLVPLLAVPFGATLSELYNFLRERKYTTIGKTVLLALILAVGISIPARLAVEGDPMDFAQEMAYYLAADAKRRGDNAEMMERLRDAVALRPDDPATLIHLARELTSAGEFDEAKQYWQKALEKAPYSSKAHEGLGSILGMQGRNNSAIEHLERALKLNPTSPVSYINLANVYMKKGNNDQAISSLYQAVKYAPENMNALINLGRLLLQKGKNKEGLYNLTRAMRLAREHNDTEFIGIIKKIRNTYISIQASAKQKNGDTKGAIQMVANALKNEPDNLIYRALLAKLYVSANDYANAVTELDQLNRLNNEAGLGRYYNNDATVLMELGKAYLHVNRLQDAREVFNEAAEKSNDPGQVEFLIAVSLRKQGNYADAMAHYQKALELNPSDPRPMIDLAILHILTKNDVDKAIELADKAYQLSFQSAAVADSYGWVLIQAGKTDQAIELLQKALEKEPDSKVLQARLTEAKKSAAIQQ